MKVKDIIKTLEDWAPLAYQESYDNSGLLVGDKEQNINEILVSIDVTEEVVMEAIDKKCNMIIAHHPLIFKGLKKITGDHWVERCIMSAVKNDIAIYAIHTNIDNIETGVNKKIAEKLGLIDVKILYPKPSQLSKLVTFIPAENVEKVLIALYDAGAGGVGNYDHCSFQVDGIGTFRPGEETQPHIGEQLKDNTVNERRVEVMFPKYLNNSIINVLKSVHPYEEAAYYLTELSNIDQSIGSGMIGLLQSAMKVSAFIDELKKQMNLSVIRHTKVINPAIKKIAICGGSGSFLLSNAIQAGADIFISGDFKYHDFFETENKIMIADIGHYESEVFTKDLLYDFLKEKFANIALRLSEVNTNPIIYS